MTPSKTFLTQEETIFPVLLVPLAEIRRQNAEARRLGFSEISADLNGILTSAFVY
jgi:hypothetical protein